MTTNQKIGFVIGAVLVIGGCVSFAYALILYFAHQQAKHYMCPDPSLHHRVDEFMPPGSVVLTPEEAAEYEALHAALPRWVTTAREFLPPGSVVLTPNEACHEEETKAVLSSAVGMARLALSKGDYAKAQRVLDSAAAETQRLTNEALALLGEK